jgi:hypothetical protein
MPSWLQGFAKYQPVSVAIDASRSLMLGGPYSSPGKVVASIPVNRRPVSEFWEVLAMPFPADFFLIQLDGANLSYNIYCSRISSSVFRANAKDFSQTREQS